MPTKRTVVSQQRRERSSERRQVRGGGAPRTKEKMIVATRGSGTPLVLIPGLHGRWEYMREAVDALAASCRVFTFALCGERASGLPLDASRGLDDFVGQVLRVLDDHHVDRAVVC